MNSVTMPSSPPFAPGAKQVSRMEWIDHLRTFVIFLVVNLHACVTYSHVGGWYIKLPPEPPFAEKVPFLFWQGHLQAFFMGLLFFIAGYFAEKSIARKTRGQFIRDRLFRLGLPSLIFMVFIQTGVVWGILQKPKVESFSQLITLYQNYISSGRILAGTGPLWFAVALLIFSIAFALLPRPVTPVATKPAPRLPHVLIMCAIVIAATFLVRTVQPIGTNIFNMQLCFFPQYIAGFIAGIAAARHSWLRQLADTRLARGAFWFGVIGGPLFLAAVLYVGGPITGPDVMPYGGGWRWQALGLAAWEQSAGIAIGLGLLNLFQRRFNSASHLGRWLSDRAFAVYVLHTPILVALALGLESIHLSPVSGALLLTILGLTASYLAADIAKRIPGLRQIL